MLLDPPFRVTSELGVDVLLLGATDGVTVLAVVFVTDGPTDKGLQWIKVGLVDAGASGGKSLLPLGVGYFGKE
eukprot:scaffold1172_cov115-Cylindrotheca_fusiformis.AAC.7